MSIVRNWLASKGWRIADLQREINRRLSEIGHEDADYELVRRWTLAPSDPLHRTPGRLAMAVLVELADGAFDANAFYPPLDPPIGSVPRETTYQGV